MSNTEQPAFDDEFERAITDWRERHKLGEEDAVLLLVELFRIHQRHWDELRSRDFPSFQQYRLDIAKLGQAARTFQIQSAALLEVLRKLPPSSFTGRVTRTAAFFAALASLLAGYLIGRVWP